MREISTFSMFRVVAKWVNRVDRSLVPVMFIDNLDVKHINSRRVVYDGQKLFYDDRGTQERWDARRKRMALKRLAEQAERSQEEAPTLSTPSTPQRRL